MPYSVKAIIPKRMRIDSITQSMLGEMNLEGTEDTKLFKLTAKTWKHQPNMGYTLKKRTSDLQLRVGLKSWAIGGGPSGKNDINWLRVSGGVKGGGYTVPRKAKALRFQSQYKAKSKPRRIVSLPGGPSGDVVFAKRTPRKGFPGRKFSDTIGKQRRKPFQVRIAKAVNRGAKRLY